MPNGRPLSGSAVLILVKLDDSADSTLCDACGAPTRFAIRRARTIGAFKLFGDA
jgi:hypothetical protein